MKKIALIAAMVCSLSSFANAQGLINFANGTGSLVTLDGVNVSRDLGLTADLYYAAVPGSGNIGDVDVSSMSLVGSALVGQISTVAVDGRISGGTFETPGTPGSLGVFQVRVSGSDATWVYSGASELILRDIGGATGSTTPASNLTTIPNPNPNGLTALGPIGLSVVPIPEPSVIALAILGGGLLLFRRKK